MFSKTGRFRGSSEKPVPVQKVKADGSDEALVTQIANLEEVVAKRTKDLEETREQLAQLSDVGEVSKKAEELLSAPNLAKTVVDSKVSETVDLSALLGNSDAEEEKKEKDATKDESLSSLFEVAEEVDNVLLGLIKSLPDVTAEELLSDAQEVESIMREWQHS